MSLLLYIFQLLFPQIRRKKPWACPLWGLYTFNIEETMHLVCIYYNSVSTISYLSRSHWCVPDIRLSKRVPDWESLTPPETPHEEKREGSVVELLPVLLLEKFYLYPLAQWGCATVLYLAKDTYLCSWNKPHHRGSCFVLGMSQHFQTHKIIYLRRWRVWGNMWQLLPKFIDFLTAVPLLLAFSSTLAGVKQRIPTPPFLSVISTWR